MRATFAFGKTGIDISVPDNFNCAIVENRGVAPLPDLRSALGHALDHPIDCEPLSVLAAGKKRVTIVVCDITRPVPNSITLPPVLDRLHRTGITRDQVTILIATGLHRAATPAEVEQIVGHEIARSYRVVSNNARAHEEHRYLGTSSRGTPVLIHQAFVDADLRVTLGFIEPHLMAGLIATNQEVYDSLILGTTITKTIDGDSKSFSFRYIDWENPGNNQYHVAAENSIERIGTTRTKRCDIIAFANGIPFVVLENKRPTEALKKATSQLIGYQTEDRIPHLFHFAQMLMTMNRQEARYATVGTQAKFWQGWKDSEDKDEAVSVYANRSLTSAEMNAIFSGDFLAARPYFEAMIAEGERSVTAQDRTLYALCRPERLLDMVRRFIIFDGGARKIARDLDRQIKDTFKACELEPVRATSGSNLLQLIHDKTPLITTIVNKFDTALRSAQAPDTDKNVFVLVDESHRTQTGKQSGHGQFAIKMRRLLPKACYLGFTGTPLLKKERNTLSTFGGLIHRYAIDEAVADQAVVPLLYEGRMVEQQISADAIDRWFEKISQGLTIEQRADLKRKFSRIGALAKTTQAIRAKAFDISEHYRMHWQGTPFKAQLVAPSKASAVRFKEVLDEIGHVSSEVIISPPDDNEGNEEVDRESKDLVRKFWDQMIARYKTDEEYNRQIIGGFKGSGHPEILIVVSKLLTGFDAPRNTVLYLCKSLREHNLLQAIARVNRLYEEGGDEKQFGFILDYEGLLGELDNALSTYSAFDDYDDEDLVGSLHDVRDEIRKLRGLHDDLLDLFKSIKNKRDMEQYEQFLADEPTRQDFYVRLRSFSRCLHISLSSDKLLDVYSDPGIDRMKGDWRQFSELKRSVQLRYQEAVNLKEFEPKIQKLLDDHVVAMPAEVVVELVNINDPNALEAVVREAGVSSASKADRIASATRRVIHERMEEDPSFYKRFSELLEETIRDYRAKRVSEKDYLKKVVDLAAKISHRDRGQDVPEVIRGNEDGQAFYGILDGVLLDSNGREVNKDEIAQIALTIIEIIKEHHIVDVWRNDVAQNKMRNAVDDYFFDVLRDQKMINLPVETMDDIDNKVMNLARARFPG